MKNFLISCILFTIDLFTEVNFIHRSWFQFSFPWLVPSLKPVSTGSKISALQLFNSSRAKHKAARCLQEANGPFPAGHGLQQA